MKIFLVIPAHNEGKRIGKVLDGLKNENCKTVVIDDGSTDNTWKVLQKFQVSNSKCQILRHKVNLGKGAAMKTGAEYAFSKGAEAIIFMDSDGQHSINDIRKFVKELENGAQFVIGTRNLSYGIPLVRYLGNKFASVFVALLFGLYVSDILCGFRGLTKYAYKKIKWNSSGYGVETEMIVNAATNGIKTTEIPVKAIYYDGVKGVTILDAFNILVDVLFWRIKK